MKISELKQPYRRMAEYLADRNTDKDFRNKEILMDAFNWFRTDEDFWHDIYCSKYPPITEEIKEHFPPDFDFSDMGTTEFSKTKTEELKEILEKESNQKTHQFQEWWYVFEILFYCRKLQLSELEIHSILSNRYELKRK